MTEAEWLACGNPSGLLTEPIVWRERSRRRWRLFALACLEPFRTHLWDERFTDIFAALAADAEGECAPDEFLQAQRVASEIWDAVVGDASEQRAYYVQLALVETVEAAIEKAAELHVPYVHSGCIDAAVYLAEAELEESVRRREDLRQVAIIHDIFGNPFRPVKLDPAWLTSDVLLLARGIYEEKAFDRMPILADALQDAGCANDEVLNHCRGDGPHVRGCWVLDLVLGKG